MIICGNFTRSCFLIDLKTCQPSTRISGLKFDVCLFHWLLKSMLLVTSLGQIILLINLQYLQIIKASKKIRTDHALIVQITFWLTNLMHLAG